MSYCFYDLLICLLSERGFCGYTVNDLLLDGPESNVVALAGVQRVCFV
jgi:hypothetical protein